MLIAGRDRVMQSNTIDDPDFQTTRHKKDDYRERIDNSSLPSEVIPTELEQFEPINHQLEIEGFFWDRDSHGLFDFESRTLKQASLTVVGCSQLAREKTMLKAVVPSLEPPSDY